MRTTLTLEPDVAQMIRLRMAREKVSLKQTINEALRTGLSAKPKAKKAVRFKVEPHACHFKPGIDRDKLNQLLDELEVEAFKEQLLRDANAHS